MMLLPDLGDFGWHQARHFSPQFARRITTLVQVWTSISLSCPQQGLYGVCCCWLRAKHFSPQFTHRITSVLQVWTCRCLLLSRVCMVFVVVTGMDMLQSCAQQSLYGVVDTGMNMSQSCTQLGLYVGCCCGCCGNTLGVTRYRFVIAH